MEHFLRENWTNNNSRIESLVDDINWRQNTVEIMEGKNKFYVEKEICS